jgi:predicted RNA-binding Zn-ribbon protein involved in translation (DUF1610 family)
MFNFTSGGFDFGRGGDSGQRTKYLLIGGLVLIGVGSLAFIFWYAFHTPTVEVPKEHHMFCLNCNQEVIAPIGGVRASRSVPSASPAGPTGGPPGASTGGPPSGPPGGPPGGVPAGSLASHMEQQREVCPLCGKATLIPERKCPKCKHYYVTDWDKTHGPMEVDPKADEFKCPNCGVNIAEYRNAHPYDE